MRRRCCCGGCVFDLVVRNGCVRPSLPLLAGVLVELLDAGDLVVDSATTDATGAVSLEASGTGPWRVRLSKTGLQTRFAEPPECGASKTVFMRTGRVTFTYKGCDKGAPYPVGSWLIEQIDGSGATLKSWTVESDPATGFVVWEPPEYDQFFPTGGGAGESTSFRTTFTAAHMQTVVRTLSLTPTNYCSGFIGDTTVTPGDPLEPLKPAYSCNCSAFKQSSIPGKNTGTITTSVWGSKAITFAGNACGGSACDVGPMNHVADCSSPPAGRECWSTLFSARVAENVEFPGVATRDNVLSVNAKVTSRSAAPEAKQYTTPVVQRDFKKILVAPPASPGNVNCVVDGTDRYTHSYRCQKGCADPHGAEWIQTGYEIHSYDPVVVEYFFEPRAGENWGPILGAKDSHGGEPLPSGFPNLLPGEAPSLSVMFEEDE